MDNNDLENQEKNYLNKFNPDIDRLYYFLATEEKFYLKDLQHFLEIDFEKKDIMK